MSTEWPTMPRADLIPWPGLNPRQVFPEADIEELRSTLRQDGMLQPVGVKLQEEPPHWIYAGERRWRAAEGVLDELPVVVRDITEEAARRLSLTENIQRESLTAMEEAWGIRAYIDASEKNQTAVAGELGKTQGWVSNRLRLLRLPETVQAQVQGGVLTASQARDLILPFSTLPQELWETLSEAVATKLGKLEKKAKGEPLADETIRMEVSKVALSMSGWLGHPQYYQPGEAWKNEAYPEHVRIPEERWQSAPSGTIVRYQYGTYPGEEKTARAFDASWWEDEMTAEYARRKAEQQRRLAEETAEVEEAGPLAWSPDLGTIPAEVEIPHGQYMLVYEPLDPKARFPNHHGDPLFVSHDRPEYVVHADVTEIPAEYLVLREGLGGSGYRQQSVVLCTDPDVYDHAVQALVATRDELEARRKGTYLRKEAKESAEIDLTSPDSLAALASTSWWVMFEDPLWAVAQDLGLEGDPGDIREDDGDDLHEGQRALRYFRSLDEGTLQEIARRTVYRIYNGAGGTQQGKNKARTDLRRTMRKELAARVDFELPTYNPTRRKTDGEEG